MKTIHFVFSWAIEASLSSFWLVLHKNDFAFQTRRYSRVRTTTTAAATTTTATTTNATTTTTTAKLLTRL